MRWNLGQKPSFQGGGEAAWSHVLCVEAKETSGRKGMKTLERLLKYPQMERAPPPGRKEHPPGDLRGTL